MGVLSDLVVFGVVNTSTKSILRSALGYLLLTFPEAVDQLICSDDFRGFCSLMVGFVSLPKCTWVGEFGGATPPGGWVGPTQSLG